MKQTWMAATVCAAAAVCLAAFDAGAQMIRRPGMPGAAASPLAGPAAASAAVKLRSQPKAVPEKTPVFKTSTTQQTSNNEAWWHAEVEFETGAEWTDELEFTWYAYVESQKEGTPMFRCVTTYVNIPKGKHKADAFLNPVTLKRYGRPKFTAVVVKVNGAVVDSSTDANVADWWNRFSPIDGVLLNRSMTPFSVLDYDAYPCIKPVVPGR